jgi:HAD superfamily hydrolase (TIGR01509 family)
MIKAVIFDMDGVLLDSERLYRMHWLETGKLYGIEEKHMLVICDRIAGGSSTHTKEIFAEELGAEFPYEEMRGKVLEAMDAYIAVHGIKLKQGIPELLEFLKNKHVKIGLATSTEQERAVRNLERAGIFSYFDGCMFGNKVAHSKPAPDIYLEACKVVGVSPKEAMGVEDSINGIFSCIHAGMTAVMVVDLIQPTPEIRQRADRIYTSALQIIEHWEEWNIEGI